MISTELRRERTPEKDESLMSLEERSDLLLRFADVLDANGESTDGTISAIEQLGDHLGVPESLFVRWDDLMLETEDGGVKRVSHHAVSPTGIAMNRVAQALGAIAAVVSGALSPAAAAGTIASISRAAPAPTWLFTLAAGSGAAALSVIFGVQHIVPVALIFVSASIGAIVRRQIARYSTNTLLQPVCAALIAGVIGGLAVQYNLSSSLRLVAVCPCMILVPGPHFLNGAMDLVSARISLGTARLIFAGMIVVAISAGLLVGLGLIGVALPVDPAGRAVPLWLDMIAAGVAVAAYSIFFSTPLRMLPWPVIVGMLAHGLRSFAIASLGSGPAGGAFVDCLVVGLVLTLVARRYQMPFAAIGFASVVSLMPGVYLFRTASGLLQLIGSSTPSADLLAQTTADGVTAGFIILAMTAGLIVPKLSIDRVALQHKRSRLP